MSIARVLNKSYRFILLILCASLVMPTSLALGGVGFADSAPFTLNTYPVSVGGMAETPSLLKLEPCKPNPFNPSTTITYILETAGTIDLAVYDVHGRLVRQLCTNETKIEGRHEIVWDGTNDQGQVVASGVYICRLASGRSTVIQRMTLLK